MFGQRLESKLLAIEEKRGRGIAALIVSFVLMLIAAIYVRPAISTVVLGKYYALLSMDPFTETANRVGYRILTPLVSYLLGLRGELIIITNLIFALGFLALGYWYFRKELTRLSDAVYATAVFAFSLVTLTTIYYGGYCDSLTYLLILLMWIHRAKLPLVALWFFLGLLNRESVAFLVPWFAFVYWTETPKKSKAVIEVIFWFGVAFGVYYLSRVWIDSFKDVNYDAEFYLKPLSNDFLAIFKRSYDYQWLGFFSVFKLFWIIPLMALYSFWIEKNFRTIFSMALLIVCVWSQQLIAYDSSRLMTMVFPIMIIALLEILKDNTFGFRSWAVLILIFNFLVPQLYTAAQIIEQMQSTVANVIDILFFGRPGW